MIFTKLTNFEHCLCLFFASLFPIKPVVYTWQTFLSVKLNHNRPQYSRPAIFGSVSTALSLNCTMV